MIEWVEMINWRVYDRRRVEFQPGITFLMGPNGAGKTSILEAIVYALIGEPSTVKDRRKLLRDPGKLAIVRLGLWIGGRSYEIERSQSYERADTAHLVRLSDNKRLAATHASVTKHIEELMGISTDFLQRMVYMAEGDVFKFLEKPPAKALDWQIRQVLGLTQLDRFVEALEAAEKEIKNRISATQPLLSELDRLNLKNGVELERKLKHIDQLRLTLTAELRKIEQAQDRRQRENEDILRLQNFAARALDARRQDPTTWAAAEREPVVRLFSQLERELEQIAAHLQDQQTAMARLDGERHSYERVLDILMPLAKRSETVACPVCSKPMTSDEREAVLQDVKRTIQRTQDEMVATENALRQESRRFAGLEEQRESLREVRNILAHVRFESLPVEATLADIAWLFAQQRAVATQENDAERARMSQTVDRLKSLDNEKAELVAVSHRLHAAGFAAPEDVADELVQLETRSLSLRAALTASQETLAHQRNEDIQAIYGQVAHVWEAFGSRGQNWRIELDREGALQMEDSHGRRFDLSQFSGGEKTALMVMLHTIISHHFSKTDFLLVDEPLEHLDAINRRSLVRFLVGAYRRDFFRQAIVATFEESLIRKYMSDEGVQAVHV